MTVIAMSSRCGVGVRQLLAGAGLAWEPPAKCFDISPTEVDWQALSEMEAESAEYWADVFITTR